MIRNLVMKFAEEAGIKLTKIDVIEGKNAGCLDAGLLRIFSDKHSVNEIIYWSEMQALQSGCNTVELEQRICRALSKLKIAIHEELGN